MLANHFPPVMKYCFKWSTCKTGQPQSPPASFLLLLLAAVALLQLTSAATFDSTCAPLCTAFGTRASPSMCVDDCQACTARHPSGPACSFFFGPKFPGGVYSPDPSSCAEFCFTKQPWWVWLIVGVVGALLLGGIVWCCSGCARRRRQAKLSAVSDYFESKSSRKASRVSV